MGMRPGHVPVPEACLSIPRSSVISTNGRSLLPQAEADRGAGEASQQDKLRKNSKCQSPEPRLPEGWETGRIFHCDSRHGKGLNIKASATLNFR